VAQRSATPDHWSHDSRSRLDPGRCRDARCMRTRQSTGISARGCPRDHQWDWELGIDTRRPCFIFGSGAWMASLVPDSWGALPCGVLSGVPYTSGRGRVHRKATQAPETVDQVKSTAGRAVVVDTSSAVPPATWVRVSTPRESAAPLRSAPWRCRVSVPRSWRNRPGHIERQSCTCYLSAMLPVPVPKCCSRQSLWCVGACHAE